MADIERLRERQDAMEKRQDSMEKLHQELMSKLGELVTVMQVANANATHRDKDIDDIKATLKGAIITLSEVQKKQSEDKPIIELVKNLNARVWALIVTAIGGALGTIAVIASQVK